VVLLSSLIKLYQGFNSEGNQKYEGRDVLESSLVSSRSKGGLAGRRTATFLICKPNFYFQAVKTKKNKRKSVRQSLETGGYLVVRGSRP